jgi:hypothetical protein
MTKLDQRSGKSKSKKDDDFFPYEPPKLRRHGKVNNTTLSTIPQIAFDGIPNLSDVS